MIKMIKKIFRMLKIVMVDMLKMIFCASRKYFIMGAIIHVCNIIVTIIMFWIEKQILNDLAGSIGKKFSVNQSILKLGILLILIVLITMGMKVVSYFDEMITSKQNLKFNQYIDYEMMNKILKLDISFFDNSSFYDNIANAIDSKNRIGFLFYKVMSIFTYIITIIACVCIIVSMGKYSAVIAICVLSIPIMYTSTSFKVKYYEYEYKNRNLGRRNSYLTKIIFGKETAKEIRIYNIQEFIIKKFIENWKVYAQGIKRIVYKYGITDSVGVSLPILGVGVAQYYILLDIINKKLDIGSFLWFLNLFMFLSDSFVGFAKSMGDLFESEAAYNNYLCFMHLKPHKNQNGNKNIASIESIEFRNVYFKYPLCEEYVLKNISFKLDYKTKLAIVGINGAGKSTLINLLLGFYKVTSGKILINDDDINNYNIESLRNHFSVIFQDFFIYDLSLKYNVSIPKYDEKFRDDDIKKSLEFAGLIGNDYSNLDRNIGRMYDEEGLELSGGQRQKLAIARCIYRKADFLIMDEPDAALDPKAEHDLLNKINRIYNEKGLIMISHRLSNTKLMDKILVLNNGELIEEGNHIQLIKKKGVYYYLFTKQANKYK